MLTKKYVDGLPLDRQQKIWKREGVELSSATMANWVIKTAQDYLKPIYNHMKRHLLGNKTIYAEKENFAK